jgi:N-acetylglucosaminyl-diphospho-decaprenol L-rhamnosyltransferase
MTASFVIIEFHSINDILNCIASIENLNLDFQYEIIVSSNSQYNRDEKEKLIDSYKSIKWSFNKYNNGFAYGMNCGIRIAKGKYVILQNPDTKIIKGDLKQVFSFIEKEKAGLIGPQIINSKNEIQDSCRPFMTPLNLIQRLYSRYVKRKQSIMDHQFDYSTIQTVDWVIGGFMIIPSSTIEKIGVFSEDYFMYVEDMDYCLKLQKNNLKVYYYPKFLIEYEGDRKSSRIFFLNKYFFIHIKNYLRFILKFYSKNFD